MNWSTFDWTPVVNLGLTIVGIVSTWAMAQFGKNQVAQKDGVKTNSNIAIGDDFLWANNINKLEDVTVDVVQEFMKAAGIKTPEVAERILRAGVNRLYTFIGTKLEK